MFKKKPTIKPLAPIRSSDRRKLADQIINDFQLGGGTDKAQDEQTPEQKAEAAAARTSLRNSLLPDNLQSARFTTTHGPELKIVSGTVYVGSQNGEEARILWFQIERKMYPSVYTLWRNPGMVPLLHTPDVVIKKLQGGADLMTPGLAGGPPFPVNATKGAVVGVASTSSPSVPVAVGVCEIDVSQLGAVQGAKGHAVENMHWAGDELWSYSNAGRPGQNIPGEIEGWSEVLRSQGLIESARDLALSDQDESGGVSLGHGERVSQQGGSAPAPDLSLEAQQTISEQDGSHSEVKELTQKEIDEGFRNAFLFGVNHYKNTNPNQHNYGLVFPLSQSSVMSNLLQPFLPAYTPEQSQQMQIKKTSWKNLKKFIKSLDKEKIIKAKEQDGHETVIFDIDFEDVAITTFKPYPLPKKQTSAGSSLGRGEAGTDKVDVGDDSVGQKLKVMSFYKPTVKLQPFFTAAGKALYTPPEIRALVTTYVESENLISETNKRLVKLDSILANSVFDGSGPLDREVIAKGSVPRDALIERILQGMSDSHAILRNGADLESVKAKSGPPPKVHISLETRSGNKTVTKVSGLEAYHVNPRPLADELRKTCAGSTSVEPLIGASKKNEKEVMEVMIQGPQKDAVIKALERRGVDKRWVEVVDKTKGKKK